MLGEMSQGGVDRYGCMLFPGGAHGGDVPGLVRQHRGKWGLPRNPKDFLVYTLQQKFPDMTARDERMLVNRINEVFAQRSFLTCQ